MQEFCIKHTYMYTLLGDFTVAVNCAISCSQDAEIVYTRFYRPWKYNNSCIRSFMDHINFSVEPVKVKEGTDMSIK